MEQVTKKNASCLLHQLSTDSSQSQSCPPSRCICSMAAPPPLLYSSHHYTLCTTSPRSLASQTSLQISLSMETLPPSPNLQSSCPPPLLDPNFLCKLIYCSSLKLSFQSPGILLTFSYSSPVLLLFWFIPLALPNLPRSHHLLRCNP